RASYTLSLHDALPISELLVMLFCGDLKLRPCTFSNGFADHRHRLGSIRYMDHQTIVHRVDLYGGVYSGGGGSSDHQGDFYSFSRSEEHTSELQSREKL